MRNPLFDTQSSVRQTSDLKQGAVFGILSLLFAASSRFAPVAGLNELLLTSSTLLLYVAVLALSFRGKLLALLLWSLVLLTPLVLPAYIRIFAFALIMLPASFSSFALLPFFVLLALWGLLAIFSVAAPQLYSEFAAILQPTAPNLARTAGYEVLGTLILQIFLWSGAFAKFMRRAQRPGDTRSVMIALCMITIFGTVVVQWKLFFELFKIDIGRIALATHQQPTLIAIGLLVLIVSPLLLGTAMGHIVLDFIAKLREAHVAGKAVFQPARGVPALIEIREVLDEVRSQFDVAHASQREAHISFKAAQAELARKEAEIRLRELDAANLERLMNSAPVGYLAVTGAGAILAINQRFFELIGIQRSECLGEHFTTLTGVSGDSTWRNEVIAALNHVLSREPSVLDRESFRTYTTVQKNELLQLDFYFTTAADLEIAESRSAQHLAISDFAVTVFVRSVPNLQDFALSRILPTTLGMLGAHALEHCKSLRESALTLSDTYAKAQRDIGLALQDPRMNRYADCLLFIREAAEFAQNTAEQLDSIYALSQRQSSELIKVELISTLGSALERLYELLGQGEFNPLELDDELLSGRTESDDTAQETEFNRVNRAEGYSIEVPRSDFYGLLASVLAVIKSILPITPELSIHLGRETIGANTASLVPNAAPGQYSRITLSHPGQSITSNMVPNNIRSVSPILDGNNELEASLAMLTIHIQRLKGFLSMMSRQSKGTSITIYIPESPNLVERRPREFERSSSRIKQRSFQVEESAACEPLEVSAASNRLLVVSDLYTEGARMQEMLCRLFSRSDATFELFTPEPTSEMIADDTHGDSFGFGGAGFDSPQGDLTSLDEVESSTNRESANEGTEVNLPDELSQYHLAVIAHPSAPDRLISALRKINESLPILVVGADPPEDCPSNVFYLSAPVDDDVVCRATRRLLTAQTKEKSAPLPD